jgi:hypothetical protein
MVRHKGVRALDTYPITEITINRNRIRKHGGNTVYMEHGTEFEIELDNNTNLKWLSKIKLNGTWVSGGGLVLRPGEHIYLERYLDENRKFLFETYNVEENRSEAIKDNGLLEIFFHREQDYSTFQWTIESFPQQNFEPRWLVEPKKYGGNPFTTTTRSVYFNTTNMSIDPADKIVLSSGRGISTGDAQSAEIETGRVEKGDLSNQQLVDTDDHFNSYHSHMVSFKILPLSQKQFIDSKDIRNYCGNCGRRQRKNDNFCPSCGDRY